MIYSEGSDSNIPGEHHINNAELDMNNMNQTDEKQGIFIENKTKGNNNYLSVGEFKLYDNSNDEESELGLSISTTPIVYPPNSPILLLYVFELFYGFILLHSTW